MPRLWSKNFGKVETEKRPRRGRVCLMLDVSQPSSFWPCQTMHLLSLHGRTTVKKTLGTELVEPVK